MALFGKKRPKVVDWTERLQKQREQTENIRSEMDSENPSYRSMNPSESSVTPFPFFTGPSSTGSESSNQHIIQIQKVQILKKKEEDLENVCLI